MKRGISLELVENPFVKEKNKHWEVNIPSSYSAKVSPPPTPKRKKEAKSSTGYESPSTAAVEAGNVGVKDHLAYFLEKLSQAVRPNALLSLGSWSELYQRNQNQHGCHFVIHQHDHPVAGTHYDLRLQINQTSSVSWAIMYGLPGDPNSRRLTRNATETRVHNLWNHLIETASHQTGSMLIWDTGEYSVLPLRQLERRQETDESESQENPDAVSPSLECEKLANAFKQRKIRLRLHGARLPKGYTIYIRLTKENNRFDQPKKPARRRHGANPKPKSRQAQMSTDSDNSSSGLGEPPRRSLTSLARTESPPKKDEDAEDERPIVVSSGDECETIRSNNAYTGASNSIGSIHQRRWYLSLDRENSGFVPRSTAKQGRKWWVRHQNASGELHGFDRFIVMGRDEERSVVTGRLARDVLADEGVTGYTPRGLWRPVTE